MISPGSYSELAEVLRGRLPKLTGGQLRIAHLLLADPEGTVHRGIADAARLTEVHESSVTRFANSLGLAGYPAVMELCRAWLAEQALVARRAEANGHEAPAGVLAATLEQEQANLTRTFGGLDRTSWLAVVSLVADAPGVPVLGLGDSAPIGALLVRRLGHARLVRDLVQDLRRLGDGEVLVAVSVRRYAADTVRAVEHARERGVTVVALTDNAASPIAEHAETALFAEIAGVGGFRSLTSLAALAQALAAEVVVRRSDLSPDENLPASLGFFHR
ncbi:MAG TPA: MurR/RpiR family transcriptional regulator [Amycolatopsis sp.]|nr:MurR/RpiR family transcriptional regulator [Amycolatopsis sp.]